MHARTLSNPVDSPPIVQADFQQIHTHAQRIAQHVNLALSVVIPGNRDLKNLVAQLAWAGYLKDWSGPAEGERPAAYIVVLGDTEVNNTFGCDHGIAAQSILLGAAEMGIGGCFIGAIDKDRLQKALNIAPEFTILLVIALGKPAETVVIESTANTGGNIRYWRDEHGGHHVPKRPISEVILAAYPKE